MKPKKTNKVNAEIDPKINAKFKQDVTQRAFAVEDPQDKVDQAARGLVAVAASYSDVWLKLTYVCAAKDGMPTPTGSHSEDLKTFRNLLGTTNFRARVRQIGNLTYQVKPFSKIPYIRFGGDGSGTALLATFKAGRRAESAALSYQTNREILGLTTLPVDVQNQDEVTKALDKDDKATHRFLKEFTTPLLLTASPEDEKPKK